MPSYPAYLALSAALLLGACANDVVVRGNFVDPEVTATIQPGGQSRQQVADLLGSPSTLSNFEDSTWYYVGQKVEKQAFFAPEVVERSVFVVTFDNAGTVAQTANYTLEDGRIIDPVTRKTPTEGRELTFLQQLFGNLGKFSGDSVTNPGRPTGS